MKTEFQDEQLMVRYLLGETTEEERDAVVDRYFADFDFLEQMTAVEQDLIDDYLHDRLPPQQRIHFEQHFLASRKQQEKVAFARTMLCKFDAPARETNVRPVVVDAPAPSFWQKLSVLLWPQQLSPGWAIGVAAVVFLVLGMMYLLVRQPSKPEDQIAQASPQPSAAISPVATPTVTVSPVEPKTSPSVTPTPAKPEGKTPATNKQNRAELDNVVASLTLESSVRGNGDKAKLELAPKVKTVRFFLPLEKVEYASYSAVIETSEREKVHEWQAQKPHASRGSKGVMLQIPAAKLANGQYLLTLNGINKQGEAEGIDNFLFNVVKK